jgi:ribosomal-protein-alanine N-acetyltransferase
VQQIFNLRQFSLPDLRRIVEINNACLPENYSDHFFIDLYRRFPETFLVAEENNKIIGYIMCRIEYGLSKVLMGLSKKGHVVSFAVLPSHRRLSIGSSLITKAMENMKRYDAKSCFLEVRVTNEAAIKLYKKLGFSITKTIRHYYIDGEDAYLMSQEL